MDRVLEARPPQTSSKHQKIALSLGKTLKLVYLCSFIRKDVKYDLRTRDLLQIPASESIAFGIDSIRFLGSLEWNSIPDPIIRASSVAVFKRTSKIGVARKAIVRYVDNA